MDHHQNYFACGNLTQGGGDLSAPRTG